MKLFQKVLPFFGLFFVSVSLMMVQILLIRFSRVAFIIDLQFIIISSAILGYGLGSLAVYVWCNHADDRKIRQVFTWTSLFYAMFSLLPFFVLHFANRYPQVVVAPLFFVSELALYILAGILIALTFRYRFAHQKTHLIYVTNMVGSGIGAFLIIFLLDSLGIYAIYINFIVALVAFLFYLRANTLIKSAILVLACIIPVLCSSRLMANFRVVCYPDKKLVNSSINSFSQVDIYENTSEKNTYELYFECFHKLVAPNYEHVNEDQYAFYNFPFLIKKYNTVAIIGAGGGKEVIGAVWNAVPNVTAIEINPLAIKAAYWVNPVNIYQNKAVKLVLQEGRDFMATTKDTFDLIYLPAAKNFGNIGLRSLALQENYLFAKETLELYLNHLADYGYIAISERNELLPKYISTFHEVLKSYHANSGSILIVNDGSYSFILYGKKGFSKKEMVDINTWAGQFNSTVTSSQDTNLVDVPALTIDTPYVLQHNYRSRPDMPVQSQIEELYRGLLSLLGIFSGLYVLFVAVLYKKSTEIQKANYAVLLFTLTGIGFISAELYLMEKVSLLLGHPSLSIAIALSLLLIFGGIGGVLAGKIRQRSFIGAALLLSTLILYLFGFDSVIRILSSIPFWVRFVVSILALAFPGIEMGALFALCLKKIQSVSDPLLPLVLTIDGFASVLGGILFKVTTLSTGFRGGLLIAILSYAGVLILLRLVLENKRNNG